MSQAITLFHYQENQIRTIIRQGGELLWITKDVCDVLGIQNNRDAVVRLDDDQKGVRKVYTPGGEQEMAVVTESGLYELIFRSDKPEARAFRKWITGEVLPEIRKTGGYGRGGLPQEVVGEVVDALAGTRKLVVDQYRIIKTQKKELERFQQEERKRRERVRRKQRKNRKRAESRKRQQQSGPGVLDTDAELLQKVSSSEYDQVVALHKDGVCWSSIRDAVGLSLETIEAIVSKFEREQRK